VILREPANALDPRIRAFWTAEGVIATTVVAGLVAAAGVITALMGMGSAPWLIAAVGGPAVVLLYGIAVVWARLDYRHFRYEVTEHGLYVSRGWLWQRHQVVPHARMQTVDTKSGPLLRAFGLVALEVTTASAAGGTSLPGLRPAVADALVSELARRAEVQEGT
jgi:uncharacterized protein